MQLRGVYSGEWRLGGAAGWDGEGVWLVEMHLWISLTFCREKYIVRDH